MFPAWSNGFSTTESVRLNTNLPAETMYTDYLTEPFTPEELKSFIGSGERFQKYVHDFIERYHFRNMYEGGFYSFDSLEEHGAYWSRYIYINRYMDTPKPVYENLYELVTDKDYFVLITNADHCFQKAGFAKERLFYTQVDYGLFQCQTPLLYKMRDGRFMHQ